MSLLTVSSVGAILEDFEQVGCTFDCKFNVYFSDFSCNFAVVLFTRPHVLEPTMLEPSIHECILFLGILLVPVHQSRQLTGKCRKTLESSGKEYSYFSLWHKVKQNTADFVDSFLE